MKISVALCTYNGELYIKEQLKSIAEQTRVPDEIILCDDKSTDSTIAIVAEIFAKTGLPISIHINDVNLGLEKNFSQAMMQTTGDVTFFCDQDDVWVPKRMERMIAPFEQDSKVTLVYSDGFIVGPDLKLSDYTLFTKNPNKKLERGDDRNIGERLIKGQSPGIKASAMGFNSKVRNFAGILPPGVAHDSWIAFFGYALGRVVAISEPLHYYRRHSKTSGGSSTNRLIEGVQAKTNAQPKSDSLKAKAYLAECLYDRMEWLTHEMKGKEIFSKRFLQLKHDAQAASQLLSTRANIVKDSSLIKRLAKGIFAFHKGVYNLEGNWWHQLSACYHDIV